MSCDCDAEMPSMFSMSHPRSRKRRLCDECDGFIEIGERFHYLVGVWSGDLMDFRLCEQCLSLRNDTEKITSCCIPLGGLATELLNLSPKRWPAAPALTARFTDIRIRRGAAICPVYHAEENELLSPFPL